MEKLTCCGECVPKDERYDCLKNGECSCHHTSDYDTTLREFDEKFPEGSFGHKHDEDCEFICNLRPRIKQFLSSALTAAEERGRNEAVDYIEANDVWSPLEEVIIEAARSLGGKEVRE